MPASTPSAPLPFGRPRRAALLVLVVAALVALGAWWSSAREQPLAPSTFEIARASTDGGDARRGDSAAAAPVPLSGARSTTIDAHAESVEPVIEFDAGTLLRGRLDLERELPRDESIEVVLDVNFAEGDEDDETNLFDALFDMEHAGWREIARVRPRADGRFELPRPVDVPLIRVRPVGAYVVGGDFTFECGGEDDPGATPFDLPIWLGTIVTLELDFGGDAAAEELAALAGDVFRLGQSLSFFDPAGGYEREMITGAVDAKGLVALGAVENNIWQHVSETAGEEQDLAPFYVDPTFELVVTPGERVTIAVPMMRGRRWEGRVVDARGEGIAGATVELRLDWRRAARSGSTAQRATTGDDGRFVFPALPGTIDHVHVEARGYIAVDLDADEVARIVEGPSPAILELARGAGPHEVTPTPAPRVSGRVLGIDPSWTEPVQIFVERTTADPARRPIKGPGTFAADPGGGTFAGQLAPGAYVAVAVSASSPAQESARVEFEVGKEDVELTLRFDRGAALAGSVRLENGTPVAGVEVASSRFQGRYFEDTATARTDAGGAFRFESQPPGRYMLRVKSARHLSVNAPLFEIEPDVPAGEIDIVVEPASAVRVLVLEAAGEPVENAPCALTDEEGTLLWARPAEEAGDWTGAVAPLKAGIYLAIHHQAVAGEPARIYRAEVVVRPGELSSVTLRQSESAAALVTGTVLSAGVPAPGVAVWLSDELGTFARETTDDTGAYRMASMVTGAAKLSVGQDERATVEEREVTVDPGPTHLPPIMLPSGAIEGKVAPPLELKGHVAAFRVGAAAGDPPFRYAMTSAEGHFTIPFLPDGEYVVRPYLRASTAPAQVLPVTVTIVNGSLATGIVLKPAPEGASAGRTDRGR